MPQKAMFLIHDNLNSNIVWYKALAESGFMFKDGILDFTLGGIPRNCFPSEWSIDRLLYLLFKPQIAYSINYILIHLLAFVGMYLFSRQYITQKPQIYNLTAIIFAVLPFWVSGGLTVAGMPFLVLTLFNVFSDKANKWDWIFFILFPFYSSLFIGNAFSFPILFLCYFIGVGLKKWSFKNVHILPFVILFLVTIFIEKRFFILLLSGFESNRISDHALIESLMNIKGIIGSSIFSFLFGHYHFHSLHIPIAISSFVLIIYATLTHQFNKVKIIILLLTTLAAFSFIDMFINNYDIKSIFGSNFPKISIRFWVWYPFIWYSIFALVHEFLQENGLKKISNVFFIIQLLFVMLLLYPQDHNSNRFAENVFANTLLYKNNEEQQTWKKFYQIEEIDQIKKRIPDITNFKVARIGVLPEILQYNGLKTIEGYYSYYPIENLRLIKTIDSSERIKSTHNYSMFSNRNFLFFDKNNKQKPDWDWKLLQKKGVKYIISDQHLEGFEKSEQVFDNNLKVYSIIAVE